MRTKEQVIKNSYEAEFNGQSYDESVNKRMNLLYILPAMDEYAKEVAIDFGKFIVSCEWQLGTRSCEELFEEYLKSKQK